MAYLVVELRLTTRYALSLSYSLKINGSDWQIGLFVQSPIGQECVGFGFDKRLCDRYNGLHKRLPNKAHQHGTLMCCDKSGPRSESEPCSVVLVIPEYEDVMTLDDVAHLSVDSLALAGSLSCIGVGSGL